MSETRDRILSATNELFRVHGYNGTTLSQITVAANATIGSIYHFFPGGKKELAKAVIETSGAAYRELFELIASQAADPAAAIGDVFEGAAAVLEETGYIDPCPIGTVAREVASTDETLRLATSSVFEGWIDSASEFLRAGGIAEDDAAELAMVFVATIEGGFVLSRAQRNPEPLLVAGRRMRQMVEASLLQLKTPGRSR